MLFWFMYLSIIDVPKSSCISAASVFFPPLKIKRLSKDLRLFRIDAISQLDGSEFQGENLQMFWGTKQFDTTQIQLQYCLKKFQSLSLKENKGSSRWFYMFERSRDCL